MTQAVLIILFVVLLLVWAAWAIIYYAAYAVRSQILGKTFWRGNAAGNAVALTFDDGPSPDTEELLDVLQREDVKATFFLVGANVEKYPETVRRIRRENHEIGNHSFSHPIFLFRTPNRVRSELIETQRVIEQTCGVEPKIARPPCGVRSPWYFAAARSLDLQTVQWSDTGYDWKKLSAREIAEKVLATAASGSIILLHDGDSAGKANRRQTVAAVEQIIEKLKEKNLRIAPLAEVLRMPKI